MPTTWEDSYVLRLRTLEGDEKVTRVVDDVRRAVEALTLPDGAKVLTAVATDLTAAIQKRNDRLDVADAFAALRRSIAMLEAIGPGLDG